MAILDGIYVYPIKSLDGRAMESVTLGDGGSLRPDRQYAMVDADGEYVNGKRTADVHRIDAQFDASGRIVTLDDGAESARFDLEDGRDAAAAWLDDRFEPTVSLRGDDELGFPDDTTDFGPTVVSTGTLETIASWFDATDGEGEMRRRLRPNLVVDAEPFWEDRLYAGPDERVRFDVDGVTFEGMSPCQRCVVPTRDPDTGETIEHFQRTFVEKRESTLPSWADERQFDHFYRVMVNTRTPEESRGESIAIGDEVVIGETISAED
jgi:uncharacterized protein YcbX